MNDLNFEVHAAWYTNYIIPYNEARMYILGEFYINLHF